MMCKEKTNKGKIMTAKVKVSNEEMREEVSNNLRLIHRKIKTITFPPKQ